MDSQLQTLAIIAAMANKTLRKTLDVEDFDGRERIAAQALKDGKSQQARDDVRGWLRGLGIEWDGKADIGEVIIESLKSAQRIRRARTTVEKLASTLRWKNLAGPQAVEEALKAIKNLEGKTDAQFESSNAVRTPGP